MSAKQLCFYLPHRDTYYASPAFFLDPPAWDNALAEFSSVRRLDRFLPFVKNLLQDCSCPALDGLPGVPIRTYRGEKPREAQEVYVVRPDVPGVFLEKEDLPVK